MTLSPQDRQRIAQRLAQTRNPVATSWAPVPYRGMRGEQASAVVPGGWFGGWLGVAPWWQRERERDDMARMGVTDGSNAKPGEVGEYIIWETSVDFVPNTVVDTQVTLGILPPGDWQAWWHVSMNVGVFGIEIWLDPIPSGWDSDLAMTYEAALGSTSPDVFYLASPQGRGLTTLPSIITLHFSINAGGATTNGALSLIFRARRMR